MLCVFFDIFYLASYCHCVLVHTILTLTLRFVVSVAPNNSMSMYSDTSAADNFTSNHNSHHSVAATSLGALSHTSASIGAGDSSTTAAALDSKRRHLSSSTSSEAGKHYPAHLNRVSHPP